MQQSKLSYERKCANCGSAVTKPAASASGLGHWTCVRGCKIVKVVTRVKEEK